MGKEISGTGMDTNVIGRRRIWGESEWETPAIEVARDLTEHSAGNGVGMGLADIITQRLHDKIHATQTNGLVSTFDLRLMV